LKEDNTKRRLIYIVHNQKTILPTFFKPLAKFCHRVGKVLP